MPITKSAKKALRQSLKRRARNIPKKQKMRNLLKEVRGLVSRKEVKEDKSSFPPSLSSRERSAIEEAKKLLPQVYKLLDKAVKNGLIKKNTAARKKSRLTRSIQRTTS